MESKPCTRCGEVKILEEFPKEKRAKGGRRNQCRSCRTKYRLSLWTKEERNKYQAEYRKTESGKVAYAKGHKKWRDGPKGKAYRQRSDVVVYVNEKMKKYRARNPLKNAARDAVGKAKKKGMIPPASTLACIACGKQAAHYHHHKGYEAEFQLDVIPLCISCHFVADAIESAKK